MKNKLFYSLFVFYIIVVALILYVNGVFTGSVTSLSNLIINLCFLVVIGVLFIISAISFTRLNKCTDELSNAADTISNRVKAEDGRPYIITKDNYSELFNEGALDRALGKYCMKLDKYHTRAGYKAGVDIEDYINEDLLDNIGLNFYNSGISGALTGLGILGTFLGLSIGLSSFSGNDIFTITDNVGPLLAGMKVAFHTSVYGIFFSLVFNVVYRSIMSDAYDKLDRFISIFRQYSQPVPSDQNGDVAAMLVYQANMTNALKELVEIQKGISNQQTKELSVIVDRFVNQMTASSGKQMSELGTTLRDVVGTETKMLESNKSIVMAVDELIESNKTLQQAVKMTMDNQEVFAKELLNQKESLDAACKDIGNQLYTFDKMQQIELD